MEDKLLLSLNSDNQNYPFWTLKLLVKKLDTHNFVPTNLDLRIYTEYRHSLTILFIGDELKGYYLIVTKKSRS